MLAALDSRLASFTWSNILGLARSLLALSTYLTLILNAPEILFKSMGPSDMAVNCADYAAISMYCLAGENNPIIPYIVSINVMVLVIIGRWIKLTALLHWYCAFSLFASAKFIDGGEHVNSLIALLLLPICLTDPRKSHWDSPITCHASNNPISVSMAAITLYVIKLQISIIYLQACIAKLWVREWVDGTALYYWLNSHLVGLNATMHKIFSPLLKTQLIVIPTWGTLVLEFFLAISLFIKKDLRHYIFPIALVFHICIGLFMGISSFSLSMTACLILLLFPNGYEINFPKWRSLYGK